MVHKITHTFTSPSAPLALDLDIYFSSARQNDRDKKGPAVLYFHGGGLVAMNRTHLPRHIVQACLRRGWPLISADYEKLPNSNGVDLVRNIKQAYEFVRENLREILYDEKGLWEEVIVMGSSAGAYLTFLGAHHLSPPPLAILTYYGPCSCSGPFFNSSQIVAPPKLTYAEISHLLSTEKTAGKTPPSIVFNPLSILDSGDPNPEFTYPEEEEIDWRRHETILYPYLLQENKYPEMVKGGDVPLEDESWRREEFPDALIIHGEDDNYVPYMFGEMVTKAIGPKARFFSVPDADHGFDEKYFLGDAKLKIVEDAWATLDEIIKAKLQ